MLYPMRSSSFTGNTGVSPPSTMLASKGLPLNAWPIFSISATDCGDSMNSTSAPALANASPRISARHDEKVLRRAAFGRAFDLGRGLVERDHAAARRVSAFFWELLILEL